MFDLLAKLLQRFTIRVDVRFIDREADRTIEHRARRPLIGNRAADDWLSSNSSLDDLEQAIEREANR